MPILDFAITADDAQLALAKLTDELEADLAYESQEQWNREYARICDQARNHLLPVLRYHGFNKIDGDCDLGNHDVASRILKKAEAFHADPEAYCAAVHKVSPEPTIAEPQAVVTPPIAAPAPSPALGVGAPVQSLEQLAPPAVAAPAAEPGRITFYDQPAKNRFPGIPDHYHSLMVPMVNWETPRPTIKPHNPNFQFNGYALKIMVSAIRRRRNLAAYGPPGCGKTEFFKQFGAIIGLPVHKIPFDGSLSRTEIIGGFQQIVTPNGSATPFVLGRIPQLIQQPGIIILDEFDQADPDIHYLLHSVYEGEGLLIAEDGGRYIPRHPHCYIVGTANTQGRGSEDGLTHVRFEMSEATRDRFPYWVAFDYLPEDKEAATVSKTTGLTLATATILTQIATSIRDAYKVGTLSQPCSLRQLEDVGFLTEDFYDRDPMTALALACNAVIVGRANREDAASIREFILNSTACDLNQTEL